MAIDEQRLQRIEDELAIGQLRARDCHLLDDMRWPEIVDLFTEDGVFEGLSKGAGRAEIMRTAPPRWRRSPG